MIVGRLCITFDRGVAHNKPQDLELERTPVVTEKGGVIRGLGTHYRSLEDRERVKRCEAADYIIRASFRSTFLPSPIPGLFVMDDRRAGDLLLEKVMPSAIEALNPGDSIDARVACYELNPGTEILPSSEILEWKERVINQIKMVPLGRANEPSRDGLEILLRLAECPVLSRDTKEEIVSLVEYARRGVYNRVDFKRKVAEININFEIEPEVVITPRNIVVEE